MQFDLSTVETATMVFFGTLVIALVIALFMVAAAFAALVLVGAGRLVWVLAAGMVPALARRAGLLWSRVARQAGTAEQHSSPSTGTYPRVALRDS